MVTGPDVVTYIGVPLAVLGVLPILYTSLKALVTRSRINRTLIKNHVVALTRGNVLSGIIEIDLPKYSIVPLDREDPQYWKLSTRSSTLRGGSWTTFNWSSLVVGQEHYRVQYDDEVRQPQALVELEALIAFLLDRGAVPDKQGFGKLRTAGLWTAAGTRLLLSPDTMHPAMQVSIPDNSDGILSLSVRWSSQWSSRSAESLPPYWMSLKCPRENLAKVAENDEKGQKVEKNKKNEKNNKSANKDHAQVEVDESEWVDEPQKYVDSTKNIHVRLSSTGISEVRMLGSHQTTIDIDHLKFLPDDNYSANVWLSSAASAVSASQGMLWSYSIPEVIIDLAKRDSGAYSDQLESRKQLISEHVVPCGVMVVMDMIDEAAVPAWGSIPEDPMNHAHDMNAKFMADSHRRNAAYRLPEAQKEAALRQLRDDDAFAFHENFKRGLREKEEKRKKRQYDALSSPKLSPKIAAEACAEWLQKEKYVASGSSIHEIVERIVYEAILDPKEAGALIATLDMWREWAQSGGLNAAHLTALKKDKPNFAYATCVVYTIQEASAYRLEGIAYDMQECIKTWNKVRVG